MEGAKWIYSIYIYEYIYIYIYKGCVINKYIHRLSSIIKYFKHDQTIHLYIKKTYQSLQTQRTCVKIVVPETLLKCQEFAQFGLVKHAKTHISIDCCSCGARRCKLSGCGQLPISTTPTSKTNSTITRNSMSNPHLIFVQM